VRASAAITGLGAVSALGRGVAAMREALRAGRDGIAPLTRFDAAPFGGRAFAALVPGAEGPDRWLAYAREAAREAFDMAGLSSAGIAPGRVAVVMGTSLGRSGVVASAAHSVARDLGALGPALTLSTACASSANAIGLARDLLARGDADVVIAGGADEVTLDLLAGFAALGVLAEGPCAPFGPVLGTTLGEGAGFLVLQRAADARRPALGYVCGYGLSSDAWHETSPDPRGAGVGRALRSALGDAGWRPEEVDYLNAHATGTAANDEAEWLGVQAAFGEHAERLPVSASKSFLGHAQGAASVLEVIATLLCMEDGAIPPSLRASTGRKRGPADRVASDRPRPHAVQRFMASSSAFAGANAALAIAREPGAVTSRERPVFVLGIGDLTNAVASSIARDDAAFRARAPSADPRTLDPLARLVVGACSAALDDAGVRLAGAARDRAGVVLGAQHVSPVSGGAWERSLVERGVTRVNAGAFARLVLHAAAGSASKALSLRGAASTIAGGAVAGLAAVAYAADLVASRDDLDLAVAGGAHEDELLRPDHEGAAFVALGVERRPGAARIAGSAFGGPGGWEDVASAAAARAGLRVEQVEWFTVAPGGARPPVEGARALVRALRSGARRAGAVAWDEGASCAVVIVED